MASDKELWEVLRKKQFFSDECFPLHKIFGTKEFRKGAQ